jgi:hypothetical protein
MPAFKDALRDRDTIAAMPFIKARCPIGLRVRQSMLNPASGGLPLQAAKLDGDSHLPVTLRVARSRNHPMEIALRNFETTTKA